MKTRTEILVALERAGAAMAHELRHLAFTRELHRDWDRALGDYRQINHMTGTPSYERLAEQLAEANKIIAALEAERDCMKESKA